MVRPDGNVVPHTVEDYLPYIEEPPEFSVASAPKPTIGLAAKKVTGEHPGAETPVGDSKSSKEASAESEENTAKSMLPDPNSLEHLLTHLPKHPGCYSCQLAKMKKDTRKTLQGPRRPDAGEIWRSMHSRYARSQEQAKQGGVPGHHFSQENVHGHGGYDSRDRVPGRRHRVPLLCA